MPRQRKRDTNPETRFRNMLEAQGRPAIAGLSRVGLVGSVAQALTPSVIQQAAADVEASGSAQLLVMSATGDSVASGGDYVAFDTVVAQQGFSGVVLPSSGYWAHPITGVYVLTYEHAWGTFQGGGDVDLELDGVVADAGRIGTRTDWQRGRGTIHYYATVGQVGRIKVTQASGSAQTCDATLWLSISDPATTTTAGITTTVELYLDDTLVSSANDVLVADHSGPATLLLGELNGTPSSSSNCTFDDVSLTSGGVELLGNASFDSALAGNSNTKPPTTGNWWVYDPGAGSGARVTSPVHSGSGAVNIIGAASVAGNCYALQDVTTTPGAAFELEFWLYRSAGTQSAQLTFGWDRVSGAEQSATITASASSVTATVLGVALPAAAGVPATTWTKVRLVVAAQEVA